MAKYNDGVVNSAKIRPFENPVKPSPYNAQAENTINVCPHGNVTVKKPNKNVGQIRSRRINNDKELLNRLSLRASHLCPG